MSSAQDPLSSLLFELAYKRLHLSSHKANIEKSTKIRQNASPQKTSTIKDIDRKNSSPIHKSVKSANTSTSHPLAISRISPSQQTGIAYEEEAVEFLISHNLHLVARNLSCHIGELDAVMLDGDELVFIEVRARHNTHYGGAAASINLAKQRRIRQCAAHFLPTLSQFVAAGKTPICRFDVVVFEGIGSRPIWLKNAFS